MKQSVFIPGIALLVMLSAARGNAQESTTTDVFDQIRNIRDIEGVRMVMLREIEGFFKGDPEQVFSCYDADNFIGYSLVNPDPKTWTIWGFGRDDIRKYADQAKTKMDVRYPGLTHTAEIQHVHVKGNNALAVARQHLSIMRIPTMP